MTEFDIDTVKVRETALLLDKEVKKYNEAIDNIYQVISKLADPAVGCLSGYDAHAYVNAVLTSKDHEQYTSLGEQLTNLVKHLDMSNDELENLISNNRFNG